MNDDHNKPIYPEKISYNKDKIEDKKRNFREIIMKGKRYKAEIREKDNQKIEVLLRDWSHKSRTKGDKEEEEAIWIIYSIKYEAKEIIFKAHWGWESHLQIKSTVEKIKKSGYWWDKMDKDIREMYFNCEICAGKTKKLKRRLHINILITIIQKKDFKQTRCIYQII